MGRPAGYVALACLAWFAAAPSPVRAYSSFGDYVRSIQEGGGGGRLFTGTPADGYGCDVCHRGAAGAKLDILGLPLDGYVPGQTYEIAFHWPAEAPHVALIAEFTTMAGQPAGTTSLAPYATWQPGELCENEFPAADVCRASDTDPGCCRDIEPERDACNFPGARSVFWLLDCGSRFARVVWTAPEPGIGDVWFSTGMVTSNVMNDALGDGVTQVRHRLRVTGAPAKVTSAVGDCGIANGDARPSFVLWVLWVSACIRVRRRRKTQVRAGK